MRVGRRRRRLFARNLAVLHLSWWSWRRHAGWVGHQGRLCRSPSRRCPTAPESDPILRAPQAHRCRRYRPRPWPVLFRPNCADERPKAVSTASRMSATPISRPHGLTVSQGRTVTRLHHSIWPCLSFAGVATCVWSVLTYHAGGQAATTCPDAPAKERAMVTQCDECGVWESNPGVSYVHVDGATRRGF